MDRAYRKLREWLVNSRDFRPAADAVGGIRCDAERERQAAGVQACEAEAQNMGAAGKFPSAQHATPASGAPSGCGKLKEAWKSAAILSG
ncbi:MAG: hypothetical protein ABSC08_02540 [Bryobacteraceae bacterium]|jgi:hypothetical protein